MCKGIRRTLLNSFWPRLISCRKCPIHTTGRVYANQKFPIVFAAAFEARGHIHSAANVRHVPLKPPKPLIFSGLCCPLQMPVDWIPSSSQSAAYKTSLCLQMTDSEQQDISNTLFSYHPPKRPKRNQGEWIERGTRDTMPTCPPSPLFLLPIPLWHPFFSSFFPFFAGTKLPDSSRFFSHGQMARSGVSPAQT